MILKIISCSPINKRALLLWAVCALCVCVCALCVCVCV